MDDRPPSLRGWMQSLQAWMSKHNCRPSWNSVDVEERKQSRRLTHGLALLQAGKLNAAEADWLRRCERARDWLTSLGMWLRDHRRLPKKRAACQEEKLMYSRWTKAQAHLRNDKLSLLEAQILKDAAARLTLREGMDDRSPSLRGWMQSLQAWMSKHNCRPSWNGADVEERKQSRRLAHGLALLQAGKLNAAEAKWLRRCEKPAIRSWLTCLAAWVRYFERRPRASAQAEDEKLQWRSWNEAARAFSRGKLSPPERQLFVDSQEWLEEVRG
ncbi:unnamed protein product [Symbiodinium natans]|uniref:Uncharacterized protein n=1 Tax=Symbiodinium natans TaxID=878477 RepID=A0A812QAI7_9DINO|nr:unnamed protein product [Symbiodinium natans]